MPRVEIICDRVGGVKVDAVEFVGQSCEDATKVFERAYVGGSRKDERKPSYYESGTTESSAVKNRF